MSWRSQRIAGLRFRLGIEWLVVRKGGLTAAFFVLRWFGCCSGGYESVALHNLCHFGQIGFAGDVDFESDLLEVSFADRARVQHSEDACGSWGRVGEVVDASAADEERISGGYFMRLAIERRILGTEALEIIATRQ